MRTAAINSKGRSMSKLTNGRILSGTTCPYSKDCGSIKVTACNGQGCPVSEGKTTKVNFSCGAARGFDMINK